MQTMFSNATVMWTEQEIVERDCLVRQCFQIVNRAWSDLNSAIRFRRVETPVITPPSELHGHIKAGFPLFQLTDGKTIDKQIVTRLLRPETTAGSIAAFHLLYPMEQQRRKAMPICIWQMGKSFRNEANPETMRASRLRLIEFYQLEFELFAAADSRAPYISVALESLLKRFGGKIVQSLPQSLPHYSRHTLDWEIDGVEVAGCSERVDWNEGIIYEVSIGLDRLVHCLASARL